MRKRVLPGAYVAAGTHEVAGVTAYCVPVNCGVLSRDSDGVGNSRDDGGVLTVMLRASNTVSIGTGSFGGVTGHVEACAIGQSSNGNRGASFRTRRIRTSRHHNGGQQQRSVVCRAAGVHATGR